MVIQRVGVLSLAKISAAIQAAIGLILGTVFASASLLGSAMGQATGETTVPRMISVLFGFGAVIFLPLVYGIIGFLVGVVGALVFNFVATLTGGLELEVDS